MTRNTVAGVRSYARALVMLPLLSLLLLPACQTPSCHLSEELADTQQCDVLGVATCWTDKLGGGLLPDYNRQTPAACSPSVADGDDYRESAGMLLRNNGTGRYRYLCSGVLVAPDLFLTAAHCFFDLLEFEDRFSQRFKEVYRRFLERDQQYYREWSVFLPMAGRVNVTGAEIFCVANSHDSDRPFQPCTRDQLDNADNGPVYGALRKRFDTQTTGIQARQPFGFGDIAVVRLAQPVDWIKPASLSHDLPNDRILGEKVSLVGFGRTQSHHANDAGIRRVKQRQIRLIHYEPVGPLANLPAIHLPVVVLHAASGRDHEICPGDSGGPLFYRGKLLAVDSAGARIKEYTRYSDSHCLSFKSDTSTLTYIGNSVIRYWLDNVMARAKPPTDNAPRSVRALRFENRFRPQNSFRLAADSENMHSYVIHGDREFDDLCASAAGDGESQVVVALNASIGQGYSSLQSDAYAATDYNIYVSDLNANNELEPPRFFPEAYAGADPNGNRFELSRLSCVDSSSGPFASCSIKITDFCQSRIKVIVERINGFDSYQLTVNYINSPSNASEATFMASKNAKAKKSKSESNTKVMQLIWDSHSNSWLAYYGQDKWIRNFDGRRTDPDDSIKPKPIDAVVLESVEKNPGEALNYIKSEAIPIYLVYEKTAQPQWRKLDPEAIADNRIRQYSIDRAGAHCTTRATAIGSAELQRFCDILEESFIGMGSHGLSRFNPPSAARAALEQVLTLRWDADAESWRARYDYDSGSEDNLLIDRNGARGIEFAAISQMALLTDGDTGLAEKLLEVIKESTLPLHMIYDTEQRSWQPLDSQLLADPSIIGIRAEAWNADFSGRSPDDALCRLLQHARLSLASAGASELRLAIASLTSPKSTR